MHRQLVNSSSVFSIGYDADAAILEVELRDGELYRYFAVPSRVYQEFMAAQSKGQFFNDFIRPRFPFSSSGRSGNKK